MAKPKGPNKLTAMIDELIDKTTTDEKSKPRGPFKAEVVNPMTDGNQHLREKDEEQGEHEEVTRVHSQSIHSVTGTRHIRVGDKQFKLVRRDPYGFWYVTVSKGKVPMELRSAYTNVPDAEKTITQYVNKASGY